MLDSTATWAAKAKEKEKTTKKKQKLLSQSNKILYNFGVLNDFFNYSAMTIQNAIHDIDLNNPNKVTTFKSDKVATSKSNIFAIAKVGIPNLILPSSLDIKLSNYNAYASYLQLSDGFFPDLSTAQHSVLVMRPITVKNGLSDYLIKILKINDFTILKRKTRMLNKSEVAFMAETEQITDEKCENYYNIMMDGEVEIIVVTKFGAVSDLKSLVDGSAPLGRRRIA